MSRLGFVLVLAVLAGCGGSSGDTTDSDVSTAFAPKSGTWAGTVPTATSNTCAAGDATPTAPTLAVKYVGNDTFLLTDTTSDHAMIQTCTLDAMAFTCASGDYSIAVGDNATVGVTVDLVGAFTDDSHFSLTTTIDQACAGSNCQAIADQTGAVWPCEGVFTTTASFTSP